MTHTSYRVMVKVHRFEGVVLQHQCFPEDHIEGDSETGNSLRFATAKEARSYGRNLFSRWTSVDRWRIKASQDPPNYRWDTATGRAVPINETTAPVSGAEDPNVE